MASGEIAGKRGPNRGEEQRSFDPYELVAALQRHHVSYVVIGALARVIHGSGEVTRALDITPSMRQDNVARLEKALRDLAASPVDVRGTTAPVELQTRAGRLKIVPTPAGTRGYDDLRRQASRESLGRSLRPQVASPGDLVRMLGTLGREEDQSKLLRLRRLTELERQRGVGLQL